MKRINRDLSRNACAFAALYFGSTSLYVLEPSVMSHPSLASAFALFGLWFALAAALDVLAILSEDASA